MMFRFFTPVFFALLLCATAVPYVTAQNDSVKEQRKSPHDTVSASIGGKNITISYGRPYLKAVR